MPLELWFVTKMVARTVNPYLDTLYSAFEMIFSGITTVQHIHGRVPGEAKEVAAAAEQVIRAYQDIGMRVSYCYGMRVPRDSKVVRRVASPGMLPGVDLLPHLKCSRPAFGGEQG